MPNVPLTSLEAPACACLCVRQAAECFGGHYLPLGAIHCLSSGSYASSLLTFLFKLGILSQGDSRPTTWHLEIQFASLSVSWRCQAGSRLRYLAASVDRMSLPQQIVDSNCVLVWQAVFAVKMCPFFWPLVCSRSMF